MAKRKTKTDTRCPRCGFQYAWDGRFCNHCHYPHAKQTNWDEFVQLERFLYAHPNPERRKLRLFGCACLREVVDLLPTAGGQALEILESADRKNFNEAYALAELIATNLGRWPQAYAVELASGALTLLANQFRGSVLVDTPILQREIFHVAAQARTTQAAGSVPQVSEELVTAPEFWVQRNQRMYERGEMPPPPLTNAEQAQMNDYHAAQRVARQQQQQRRELANQQETRHCQLYRDIFRYPFGNKEFRTAWISSTVYDMALSMERTNDYSALPILSDALQDAGCDDEEVIAHCLRPGPHVRGCWVIDLILGRK